MKTMYDFLFCQGVITKNVVWYRVRVGKSVGDMSAHARINALAKNSTDMYFVKHDSVSCDFINQIAESLFPQCPTPILLLRTCTIDVRKLDQKIRNFPLCFLNSESVETDPVSVDVLTAYCKPCRAPCPRKQNPKGKNRTAIPRDVKNLSKQ